MHSIYLNFFLWDTRIFQHFSCSTSLLRTGDWCRQRNQATHKGWDTQGTCHDKEHGRHCIYPEILKVKKQLDEPPWSSFSHVFWEGLRSNFTALSPICMYSVSVACLIEWKMWMLGLSWLFVINIIPDCKPYPAASYTSTQYTETLVCSSTLVELPPPWPDRIWVHVTQSDIGSLFSVNSRSFLLALHHVRFMSSLCPVFWICRCFCSGERNSWSGMLTILTILCLVDDI